VERNFFGDESLTDIARDLGVTLSRVSQMRARALTLLHAVMSEVWEGQSVAAGGGVRARNQQRAYVDRVAAGRDSPRQPAPSPAPTPAAPIPSPRARRAWETSARFPGPESAAQPA
jgi:RNA polymerase sigma factor FliA